jgi:1-acyl-sn-glycerol-3-phosphate acyltransferase
MSSRTLVNRPAAPGALLIARSAVFNLACGIWTCLIVLAGTAVVLLPARWTLTCSRVWMLGVQWLLRHIVGLSYEVRGRSNMPPGPAIYAIKHQSAWETLATHLLVPDAAIALKQELMQIPLFGRSLRHAGMIGVDRAGGMRALRALVEDTRAALRRDFSVIIFPVGHRIPPGQHAPYHPGVAALYTQLDRAVVPIALNSGLYWGRRSFVKRPGRIVVEFLEPIQPGLGRKAFMAELQARLDGACDRLIDEAGGLRPN